MISRDAVRIALQIALVSLASYACGSYFTAALRFAESCIGTALAVLAVLMWPGPAERQE